MNDLAGKVAQARCVLNLKRMMEQRGKGPSNGTWRSFPKCPFCGKDGAGVFEHNGRQWFKCHHTSCRSGTAGEKNAWDEVGFLAYELGTNRREAFKTWLKEAGVLWEEPPKRGTTRRSEYLPEEQEAESRPDDNLPPEAEDGPGPWDPEASPEPPSAAELEGAKIPQDTAREVPSAVDGGAAVPDPPPVADGVNASPAAPAGVPTPEPGEASLSPAPAAGSPGVSAAEPKAQDGAPPAESSNIVPLPVQTSACEEDEDDATTDEEAEPDKQPATVQAIRCFYERLTQTEGDCAQLEAKRGLSPSICCELGLRSSLSSNREILLAMQELFPMEVLLASGLWERGDGPKDEPQPNRFYYGRGPAGKRKDETGQDVTTFDWTHPILIPYLNRRGEVIDLRTHKWTQKGQAPRLYVPRRLGQGDVMRDVAYAIITEGEFKAMALYQALPRALVAALPGISMSKLLWASIKDWLFEELPAGRPVVVVFDNEDKGKEGLPGYKADWRKRHDTELWARYLEQRLAKEGFPARIGILPDTWRDEKGKADWDGALAVRRQVLGRQEVMAL